MNWYGIFQATIDRAPMTSSEKMTHLQSLITGEAKAWSTAMVAAVTYTL